MLWLYTVPFPDIAMDHYHHQAEATWLHICLGSSESPIATRAGGSNLASHLAALHCGSTSLTGNGLRIGPTICLRLSNYGSKFVNEGSMGRTGSEEGEHKQVHPALCTAGVVVFGEELGVWIVTLSGALKIFVLALLSLAIFRYPLGFILECKISSIHRISSCTQPSS
jgi:hypothetical protein